MEELEETLDVDVAALPQKATKVPQDPGETPIFRLLRLGLLQKAEVALRKLGQMPTGLAVNAREEKFEWGLLHFAAHKGEVGLLDWLLRQKARPDMADGEGNTPLVLCAKSNHVQAMEMLMARGASIAQRTKEQGFTPLLWAASGGHQRISFTSRNLAVISESRLDEFMRAELSIFAKQRPPQPLSFLEVLRASSCLQHLARLVHQELPVRFARRLKHIERVENWAEIPEMSELHGMHIQSFKELRLADPSRPEEYAEVILQIRQRHKRLPRLFAEAVKRIGEGPIKEADEEPSHLELWAETFLRSRVSTELLMSHFEACVKTADVPERSKVGIIDTKCDPWQICQAAISATQDGPHTCLIEAENTSGKVEFCHVPRYLFYIMEELLSNSARAAAAQAEAGQEMRPIRVSLCADDGQVVIRISDRAGGMHSKSASQVWSYLFTTSPMLATVAQRAAEPRPWGVEFGESPMAGRGIGLPLCRLYAMYLGGSLHLMNLPGLGVDAYLFLNRIDPEEALHSLA
ncbi:unnamed protein product [Effrenium voratum]|nr:unnamed protein product [Effrenium voratum]